MGAASLLGLALLAACGYAFAVRGPLPAGVQVVDVPVALNQTTETGVEGLLTDAIRHRLAELGYQSGSGYSATLVATVVASVGYPLAPKVAVSDAGIGVGYAPGLYAVTLGVSAKLVRGEALLWQADNIVMSERYLPSDDLATLEAHRREAVHRLTKDLARELVARLTSGL